jgi:hypothetical protein
MITLNGTTGINSPGGDVSVSQSLSGNLAFTGTGNRITGDFSNATVASRVAFQSSTTNGSTQLTVAPNGTRSSGTTASALSFEDSAGYAGNGTVFSLTNFEQFEHRISSGIRGSGAYVPLTFYTGGSERVRIDTSGNVGVGTSSPGNRLHVVAASQSDGNGLIRAENTATTPNSATNTSFVTKSYFGTSQFMQWENNGVRIGSRTTANGGVGAIVFTSGNDSERMRLDSSGNLLVGTTSSASVSARVNGIALKTAGIADIRNSVGWNFGTSGSSGIHLYFYTDNGSTFVTAGQINSNGSTTAYVTSSDYRLKENVQPLTNALGQVSQLRPVVWKWKDGVGGTNPNGQGFIAHELQAVCPDAVTGEKDAVDKDGKPQYQGVDTSFLVATLVSAIQELTARLEVLENK